MFRRSLAFAFLVFCVCSLAEARPYLPWSYEKLNKHADVVAIVTVNSTEAFDEPFDKTTLGSPEMVGRLTTFEVKTVIKGRLVENDKELRLVHFTVSEKETIIDNGPRLPEFRTGKGVGVSPHYLIFLKARKDGTFEPVSGQVDSAFSVMVLKPELAPIDFEDE